MVFLGLALKAPETLEIHMNKVMSGSTETRILYNNHKCAMKIENGCADGTFAGDIATIGLIAFG
jgi:hypothetical protein